jgi:hypothetical protein
VEIWLTRSLHTTPAGALSSAFAGHVIGPACVSSVVRRINETSSTMKITSIRRVLFYTLTLASVTCLSGCFSQRPVRVWHNAVEVYNYADKNYRVSDVAIMGQAILMSASFVWSGPGEAGYHSVYWELYKEDQCIRKDPRKMYFFTHSPYIVPLQLDATALGEGTFRGVLYVDDIAVATNSVTVKREKQ